MRRLSPLLAPVCVVALGLAGGSCGGSEGSGTPQEENRAPSVEAVTIEPESLRDVVDFAGQLEAEESVEIRPEVEGVIASVHFEEGQRVEEGSVLFRLRSDEQRARYAEVRASLALAQDEQRRTRALVEHDAAATARLERATAELEVAKARLEVAHVALERTALRAPFAGVVGARLVSPGDHVNDEISLVRIEAVSRLQAVFTVPEQLVNTFQIGMPLEVEVAAYPGERFPGTLFFISPSIVPESRRLRLKVWVPNPEGRLRPGMFLSIGVEIASRDDVLVIPEAALVSGREGLAVWRLDERDRATRVPVEIGLRRRGDVEVTRGLQPGDRIVTAGTHKIVEGERVAVVQPPAEERGE